VEPRDEREIEVSTRRRTISGDTLVDSLSGNGSSETISKVATRLVSDAIEELDLAWKMKELPKSRSMISVAEPKTSPKKHKAKAKADFDRRRSLRSVGEPVETLTEKLSVLSKRGRNAFEASIAKGKRELKRLADTNEFAKIETQPVLHEVWSCGKLVMGDAPPPKKRVKAEPEAEKVAEEEPVPEEKKFKTKRDKIWLSKGLYAGQEGKIDLYAPRVGKGRKSLLLVDPSAKPRTMLPLPIWAGQRLLETGRDFKLPFDVCSPLPPGQPKPDEWRKFSKSEYCVTLKLYLY
jgi:histone-lysine N-methyltransferase ASH1L